MRLNPWNCPAARTLAIATIAWTATASIVVPQPSYAAVSDPTAACVAREHRNRPKVSEAILRSACQCIVTETKKGLTAAEVPAYDEMMSIVFAAADDKQREANMLAMFIRRNFDGPQIEKFLGKVGQASKRIERSCGASGPPGRAL